MEKKKIQTTAWEFKWREGTKVLNWFYCSKIQRVGGSEISAIRLYLKSVSMGFPGSSVVKNSPVNAEVMGSIPGPGRSHTPQSNYTCVPQLPSHLLQLPWSVHPRACAPQQRSHRNEKSGAPQLESSPRLPQLEKSPCSNKDLAHQK